MTISERLRNEVQIHVAWSGRVSENLEAEFDVYYKSKNTFSFNDVVNAIDRNPDPVYEAREIAVEVERKIMVVKDAIMSISTKLRLQAKRVGIEEAQIQDSVIVRAAREIEARFKKDCAMVFPDMWLPNY